MGLSPREIDDMSIWQYLAVLEGYSTQNDKGDRMTESEKDDIWDWLNSDNDNGNNNRATRPSNLS